MKILMLGPYRKHMVDYLESSGDEVESYESPVSRESKLLPGVDFIISYGYRHIIKKDVLKMFPRRVINLHISLLPWNRGTDPNLWSFLEDTPKGVTIHYIDSGIDTGEILAQKEITFDANETLRTSYDKLSYTIERLFKETWPEIRVSRQNSYAQPAGGTFHSKRDRTSVEQLLKYGWDTPVANLIGKTVRK